MLRRKALKRKRATPRRRLPKVKSGIRRGPKRIWKTHDDWVRTLPCIFCGCIGNTVQAHISTAANSGKGIKAFSWCTVPMCWDCHSLCHLKGHVTVARHWGIDGLAGLLEIATGLAARSPDVAMILAMKEAA